MGRTKQTARNQDHTQDRSCCRRSQETPSLPSQNCRAAWDLLLPEVNRLAHLQGSIPTTRPWDCTRLQERSLFPVHRHACSSGGLGGLPRWAFRRRQLVPHPCQACDDDAEGHSACLPHPRRTYLDYWCWHLGWLSPISQGYLNRGLMEIVAKSLPGCVNYSLIKLWLAI